MSFENIIGNENIKDILNESVKKNNILHSYMFIGQEGIGKQIFAKEFAKMILCKGNKLEKNDECESCIKFKSENHPDFLEIQPDGNSIKIAQIRAMQDAVYIKPIVSDKKVFIINNAEKMTEEAQNSLLKTLEEPPEYIVIILIVANENLLLSTIKSRCIKINFSNIAKDKIVEYIKQNNIIENPTENLVSICNGSIGKIEKVKENINTYIEIENLIKDLINKKFNNIAEFIKSGNLLYKNKDDIQDILEYIVVIFYNLIKKEEKESINLIKYLNIIKYTEKAKVKLNFNSNYDMTIDELLFRIWEEINEKYSRS